MCGFSLTLVARTSSVFISADDSFVLYACHCQGFPDHTVHKTGEIRPRLVFKIRSINYISSICVQSIDDNVNSNDNPRIHEETTHLSTSRRPLISVAKSTSLQLWFRSRIELILTQKNNGLTRPSAVWRKWIFFQMSKRFVLLFAFTCDKTR